MYVNAGNTNAVMTCDRDRILPRGMLQRLSGGRNEQLIVGDKTDAIVERRDPEPKTARQPAQIASPRHVRLSLVTTLDRDPLFLGVRFWADHLI